MVRLTEKLYRSARLRGAGVIDSAADAAGGASGATVPFASNSAASEQWMFHGTHSTPPQRVYSSHSEFDMRMSKDGCVLCASVACGSELPRWNALTVCVGFGVRVLRGWWPLSQSLYVAAACSGPALCARCVLYALYLTSCGVAGTQTDAAHISLQT